MRNRIVLFAACAVILAALGAAVFAYRTQTEHSMPYPQEALSMRTIQLKGVELSVLVAASEADRERGLSGLPGLSQDSGMLFIFEKDGRYGFWMKDMRFSIDIVWLSADGEVLYVAKSVSPGTYPTVFGPETPARLVLELPAGWADAHKLAIGDRAGL